MATYNLGGLSNNGSGAATGSLFGTPLSYKTNSLQVPSQKPPITSQLLNNTNPISKQTFADGSSVTHDTSKSVSDLLNQAQSLSSGVAKNNPGMVSQSTPTASLASANLNSSPVVARTPQEIAQQNATNNQPAQQPGATPLYSSSNPATYPGLINQLANSTANNSAIGAQAQDIANNYGQQIANVGQLGGKAQAGYLTTGTTPVAEGNSAIQAQSTAAQQGALAQGESAALQGIGYQLTGQNQLQSGLGTAASQTQPIPNAPYLIDPVTGKIIGGGGDAKNAIINAGSYSTIANQTQAYNQGLTKIKAADNIQNNIVNTLNSNPDLNSIPVTQINNLSEWLSGQTSDPRQQVLSQQVAQYIQTLGLDPATVTNIALQQRGTIADLLDALRQSAVAINEGQNPQNVGSNSNTSNSGNTYKGYTIPNVI